MVNVTAVPTVAPTATTGTICSGDYLQLTAGGAGGSTYAWSGPNGFASTAANPLVTPATDDNGTYTVVSTNAAGCGSAAASVVVNNVEPVVARPIVTGTDVCSTGNIVLASSDSPRVSPTAGTTARIPVWPPSSD